MVAWEMLTINPFNARFSLQNCYPRSKERERKKKDFLVEGIKWMLRFFNDSFSYFAQVFYVHS